MDQNRVCQQHFLDCALLVCFAFLMSKDLAFSQFSPAGFDTSSFFRFCCISSKNGSSTLILSLTLVAKYFRPVFSHHFLICYWLTFLWRSILFPTSTILAPSVFDRHSGYHWFIKLSKVLGLVSSKTKSMPWQPLKYVETMDRYRSCPAVSQIYSLIS